MNVKSDGESRKHHYTTKLITIPYVPNGNSRDRLGEGGESRMPEGKGNKHPNKNQRHHHHHPMHQALKPCFSPEILFSSTRSDPSSSARWEEATPRRRSSR